jgi:DNA-binding NarL/FixJ family response regulator
MDESCGDMTYTSRIAIVEHYDLARRGLENLLSISPLLRVVAVVAEPPELDGEQPPADVIVFGPSLRADEGLTDQVGALSPHGRVLVISDFTDRQPVAAVLRAGAYGCVTRHEDDDELLRAVTTVALGGLHVAPSLAARLHTELQMPAPAQLALPRREAEALRLLAAGLTHGQIARRMNLTEATVSTYVKRIRAKLNVGNKADLTRKAVELGLLRDDGEPSEAGRASCR